MNREEILTAAHILFHDHFRRDDPTGSMTAARAGMLLKKHMPKAMEEGRFEKFSDLLRELEARGDLRTGFDSKNVLAIWLPQSDQLKTPFEPLRDDIWRAFIGRRPAGGRYFNRTTGAVRLGIDVPPWPTEQWTKIEPLSDEKQKNWAVEFLREAAIESDEIAQSLDQEPWYFHFSVALGTLHPDISRQWKRWRSERVVSHVNEWCFDNGIVAASVFQAKRGYAPPEAQIVVPHAYQTKKDRPDVDIREAILTAVAKMSTDDLLKLSIPARCFLEALNIEVPKQL